MERKRVVDGTGIKTGGRRALCTLHRAEDLYGEVRYRGYMRDSCLET